MTCTVASNTVSSVLAERAWLGDFLGCDTLAFFRLIAAPLVTIKDKPTSSTQIRRYAITGNENSGSSGC
jgi:hypothetical protein